MVAYIVFTRERTRNQAELDTYSVLERRRHHRRRSAVTDAVTPADIFKVGFGFWASKTLLSAVELGLFTELPRARPTSPAYRAGSACMIARPAIFSMRLSR